MSSLRTGPSARKVGANRPVARGSPKRVKLSSGSSELDRQRLGQAVIEAATRLTGAAYGALFERVPASADAPERGAAGRARC
jgi:hypothetical protein